MRLSASILLSLLALSAAACGGGVESGAAVAAAPPSRSGEVWEVQGSTERAEMAGAVVAFVNGVHVMVVDGDRIYAGMTELRATDGANGARTVTFPSGLTADLVRAGTGAELRFSSGERVAVKERSE